MFSDRNLYLRKFDSRNVNQFVARSFNLFVFYRS